MRPNPPRQADASRTHPALAGFAEDCGRTLMGLVVYVGALALIGSAVVYAAAPLTDMAITAATDAFAGRIDLASDAGADADGGRRDTARRPAPGAAGRTASGAPPFGLRGAL
ncbi:hypothetical protein LPW26_18390 [Rhodopseudomonas sp. HC1]|uniref:hypothetical protein n=1 Tax=Rhodopseudomonas infernalis TaxID=2897386 RepID=UPI001EE89E43|nr:hypothetical protein [Rhodopseudomonas infernalis]MCG6206622.1 hypothetical protein [Rhodopseudomonas infernalis]